MKIIYTFKENDNVDFYQNTFFFSITIYIYFCKRQTHHLKPFTTWLQDTKNLIIQNPLARYFQFNSNVFSVTILSSVERSFHNKLYHKVTILAVLIFFKNCSCNFDCKYAGKPFLTSCTICTFCFLWFSKYN